MPSYAYVHPVDLRCPECDVPYFDSCQFQWGYCAGKARMPDSTYVVGERLRWRHCADGSVLPWTYFRGVSPANLGDPHVVGCVCRDRYPASARCPACGIRLYGTVVRIFRGVVEAAWLSTEPFPDGVDVDELLEDGSAHPRPDWYDRGMGFAPESCGEGWLS
jgi:hypothetical protein